jgi:hypothetical protein
MKSGILDRKDVGVFTRFIVVRVPVTCRGDERGTRYPVFPVTVLDHTGSVFLSTKLGKIFIG